MAGLTRFDGEISVDEQPSRSEPKDCEWHFSQVPIFVLWRWRVVEGEKDKRWQQALVPNWNFVLT